MNYTTLKTVLISTNPNYKEKKQNEKKYTIDYISYSTVFVYLNAC